MNRQLFGFIPIYGLLIAAGIGLGVLVCSRREKEMGLPRDISVDLALWAVPAAVVGSRLYYVAFQWSLYANDPLRILAVWEGGLAIYGGVMGGALGVWLLSKRKKVSFPKLADFTAPSLILGQAIGRWGNFFNGEAYGYPVSDPNWQFFPVAVNIAGQWHMATFFYESVWDLGGFLFLWLNRKKTARDGDLFLLYLIWYGFGRAIIEGLRTDSLMLGSLRVSQWLSGALCLAALCLLLLRKKKNTVREAQDN